MELTTLVLPGMFREMNWGILGAGRIASQWTIGMRELEGARIIGVGSSSPERAKHFCKKWVPEAKSLTYSELIHWDEIECVYIAGLHPIHAEHAILAMRAGKHVLVEKPLCMNEEEARRIQRVAQEEGVLCMEAMWIRFLPHHQKVREWVKEGAIGELISIQSSFGYPSQPDPKSRLWDPEKGGGALLDVGIYPVSYLSWMFGRQPAQILSHATQDEGGVDASNMMIFDYGEGQTATAQSSMVTRLETTTQISGSKGSIWLEFPCWWGHRALLRTFDGKEELIEKPYTSTGLQYQVAHFEECLQKGVSESPVMPLTESIEIMKSMDLIRSTW